MKLNYFNTFETNFESDAYDCVNETTTTEPELVLKGRTCKEHDKEEPNNLLDYKKDIDVLVLINQCSARKVYQPSKEWFTAKIEEIEGLRTSPVLSRFPDSLNQLNELEKALKTQKR